MTQFKLYVAKEIFSTEINGKWHNLNEKWHTSTKIWQTHISTRLKSGLHFARFQGYPTIFCAQNTALGRIWPRARGKYKECFLWAYLLIIASGFKAGELIWPSVVLSRALLGQWSKIGSLEESGHNSRICRFPLILR